MGIFIKLCLSPNITQKEWEPVYKESFMMAQKFHLVNSGKYEKYGQSMYVLTKKLKENVGEKNECWCAVGDYESMDTAEAQVTYRYLKERNLHKNYCLDPMITLIPDFVEDYDVICKEMSYMWGNKTQGEAYHLYLLAIGCMMETRLPGKVTVSGDITAGQCQQAVNMANSFLENKIDIPVRCRLNELCERVCKLPIKKDKMINALESLYLGNIDRNFYETVGLHFDKAEIEQYWRGNFHYKVSQIEYKNMLKKYLNSGGSIEKLCDYTNFEALDEKADAEGQKSPYKEFIHVLLSSHIHLEEKDIRDCLEIDREQEGTYSTYTLLAQAFLGGAKNHNVEVYVPLEQLRKILIKTLGDKCDVNEQIDKFLREDENEDKPNNSKLLNDYMDEERDRYKKNREEYDISRPEHCIYYKQGDYIAPELLEMLINSFRFYNSICNEQRFAELCERGAKACCKCLVEQNVLRSYSLTREITLLDEMWDHIFDEIRDDINSFKRYYPMIRVNINEMEVYQQVLAYVLNDDFYAFINEQLQLS